MGFNQTDNPFLVSTLTPLLMGVSYVASLYVWPTKHERDHPDTIKRRFVSAAFMTVISPLFVTTFGAPHLLQQNSLCEILGLRLPGLIPASIFPVLLTVILFLGPTVMLFTDPRVRVYWLPMYWKQSLKDWIWWRNHVVAPFSEEFTFRACMVPILLGYYTKKQTMLISPLFFGVAHFHHMVERIRKGQPILTSFLFSMFQFTYTTIFGTYSAFLFLSTGHFATPFLVHAYCNFMGFPDIAEVLSFEPKKRLFVSLMFILGAILFYFVLTPVTSANIYLNFIYADLP
ncbi:CAAX prenyl protease 2 [Eurytemora carolleeae]|uniref:CAAX prenyl protease 2 n=1 Tax=Eurytemora carolleeae TaxID=1294199 RepID=UPI000C7863BF|nr:CAAX prenyl protease 2 [Eurytemora carolleeae]|eukprot:XP_023322349.1 CAAX prenyl protease 2-like [Eurytemora affinis]